MKIYISIVELEEMSACKDGLDFLRSKGLSETEKFDPFDFKIDEIDNAWIPWFICGTGIYWPDDKWDRHKVQLVENLRKSPEAIFLAGSTWEDDRWDPSFIEGLRRSPEAIFHADSTWEDDRWDPSLVEGLRRSPEFIFRAKKYWSEKRKQNL